MTVDTGESSIGKITSGITTTLAEKTVEFVYRLLPEWRDDPDRPGEASEKKLNIHLCKFLDSCARNEFTMIRFDHEEPQTGRRSIDLSVSPTEKINIDARQYTIYEPFLVFECKRLPAPPPKDREKEYVTGGKKEMSGGIQRFKTGQHGAELERTVMIGYIQKRTPKLWHSDINAWITKLAAGTIEDVCEWKACEILDHLTEDSARGVARSQSTHVRTIGKSASEIRIDHLWVVMS